MEFLGEVLDFCVELLGEVFVRWMQNLARANRRLYIGLFGLLLLALAGGRRPSSSTACGGRPLA